ncbi:MAG TPA: gluconokinase, partial [Burkholderiales bacterium]|nr:gluconokinase [Burkholderiales bacterium]
VFLHATFEVLKKRLEERKHRYMPASLLQSQFATLEPPAQAIRIDVAQPQQQCVEMILCALQA